MEYFWWHRNGSFEITKVRWVVLGYRFQCEISLVWLLISDIDFILGMLTRVRGYPLGKGTDESVMGTPVSNSSHMSTKYHTINIGYRNV